MVSSSGTPALYIICLNSTQVKAVPCTFFWQELHSDSQSSSGDYSYQVMAVALNHY